jgi:hypothetical protein
MTALGGYIIGVADEDVSVGIINPASINEKMHNKISFAQNFHFADITHGSVSYGRKISQLGGIHSHIAFQYINYGDFVSADEYGTANGNFSGSETAIILGASKKLADRICVGANFKNLFSSLERYASYGMSADLGINYTNDSSRFTISMLVRNVGYEFTTFANERRGMPLDVQIGLSKRLKHLPFRYSIIGHQLHKGNIRYDDPDRDPKIDIFGQPIKESKFANTVDNIFRHVIISGEFLLGRNENLRIRFGYNHLRRKELSLPSFRSLAGFGLGFGIKISHFKLDYGVGYYHLAGATNHVTISTDLGKFFKKI